MEWEKLFRRYVWNTRTTPYLTPVSKLVRQQADSEILFYCLLHGLLFAVIAIASLRAGPHGQSPGMAYYSFSVVCAAVLFGMMKNYHAALYLSATPLFGLLYLYNYRSLSGSRWLDTTIVLVLLVLLLRYSLRVIAIARTYHDMPTADPDDER